MLTRNRKMKAFSKSHYKSSIPLAMASAGDLLKIVEINAGQNLCKHLISMGLVPGVDIEILSKGFQGPMIISIKGARLALGRGLSHKVLVR